MTRLMVGLLAVLLLGCSTPANPDGDWQGTLKVPGGELRVVVHVARDSAGRLAVTMDSPDQGANGIPADSAGFADGKLSFTVGSINGSFHGQLGAGGKVITGMWKQGPFSLPLELKRADRPVTVNRPQEPKPPYPYRAEDVTFENRAAGVVLAGTLTLPDSGGPFPAVVLISGSGPEDRDEAVFGHKPFLVLADYLTRRGIAVLRYDDRGVGKSTGDHSVATTEDFAGDALAAVAYLKTRPDIGRIGLLGHSEGGIIAPLAANRSPDVAFIVLMAGTGLRGDSILVLQSRLILKSQGATDSAVEAAGRAQRRVMDIILAGSDTAAAAARLRADIGAMLASEQYEPDDTAVTRAAVEQQIKQVLSPWFRYFAAYDPAPALRRLKVPVLAVVGGLDVQVAPDENLAAIEAALRSGGNPDYTVRRLEGLNHLLQRATTGSVTEYARIEETIAPEALALFGDWILARAQRR